MQLTHQQKQRNTSIFLSIFGAFFLLPGLGLLIFKAIPKVPRLFSSPPLSGEDLESILAAGIVGLVFSLIGCGAVFFGLKKPSDDAALLDSDTPWLGRKKWAANSLNDSFALTGGFIWGFAIVWNLLTVPALLAFSDELDKGNQLIWFVLLFPLAGLYLIGMAIHKTLDWRRFGQMKVKLEPYPGAIGGDVAGTIHLSTPLPAGTPVNVSLDCVRHYRQGKNSSQSIVWQHFSLYEPLQSSRSTTLPFLFEMPADLPPSSTGSNSHHVWTLRISAKLPGVDLMRQIELPVFPTEEKASASFKLSLNMLPNDADSINRLFANNSGEEQAIIGDHRNKGFGTGLTVGLGFMAIGTGLAYFIGHLKNESFLLGFGALFSLIGFTIFWFSISGRFRHYYLRLSQPMLEFRYRRLFGGKVVTLNYNEIAAVTTESRGAMTIGNKHYQFFNLGLKLKNDKALRIGDRFSRQQVEKTALALAQSLGVVVEEKTSRTSRLSQNG